MKRAVIALICGLTISANAHAGFGTGLLLGYLFGASTQPEKTVEHIRDQISPEDELYREFTRNKEAAQVTTGDDREALLRRNRDIAGQLVQKARENYVARFDLKLNEIKRTVVETDTAQTHLNDDMGHRVGTALDSLTFQQRETPEAVRAQRSQVVYGLSLAGTSPLPISTFDILVDGKKLPVTNGVPQYTAVEQFGHNQVEFQFVDKKDPSVKFTIKHEWDVQSALSMASEVREQDRQTQQENSLSTLFYLGMGCILIILFISMVNIVRNDK